MDLTQLAGQLAKLGAPILGTALGGPAGGALASTIIGALADAFAVPATPEAVEKAIATHPAAAEVVREVEARRAPSVIEELNAQLADVQDARAATVKLVDRGSAIAWGAPIVSLVVMIAFSVFSWLAIISPISGPAREVVMYLLGAWQGLSATVVAYWVGSSVGSKDKDTLLAALAKTPRR